MIRLLQKVKWLLLLHVMFDFNMHASDISRSNFVKKLRIAVAVTNASSSELAQEMQKNTGNKHDSEVLAMSELKSGRCSHVGFIQSIKATQAPSQLPCHLEISNQLSPLDLPMAIGQKRELSPFSLLD